MLIIFLVIFLMRKNKNCDLSGMRLREPSAPNIAMFTASCNTYLGLLEALAITLAESIQALAVVVNHFWKLEKELPLAV